MCIVHLAELDTSNGNEERDRKRETFMKIRADAGLLAFAAAHVLRVIDREY